MYLLYIIIVGLIAGWATGKIMKGAGYGAITDILLGIAGAIVGSRLLGLLGIYSSGGIIPNILVAIVGAIVLVLIVRLIKKA
jgi:uncharacterized membrane protein YeaQ/YmgE (transglycosylase-associated protein family)